jgi:hypothetical protein
VSTEERKRLEDERRRLEGVVLTLHTQIGLLFCCWFPESSALTLFAGSLESRLNEMGTRVDEERKQRDRMRESLTRATAEV